MLTRDVRDARERARDATLPEMRRARLLEMADAMDMFCQGVDGEMFDRSGTPWPRRTSPSWIWPPSRARATTPNSIAYISLINTVNNIAERDQFLGRPIINVTDEGHIITKNPLLAPYVVKITRCGASSAPGSGSPRRTGRPAESGRAHAQHDRVVDLPVDAAR